jgi:hypothetical protein
MMAVFHHGVLSSPAAGRLDGEKCPRKLVARSFPKDACTFFRLIVGFVLGAEGLGVVGDYVCFLYFLWGCLGLFYSIFSNFALCFLGERVQLHVLCSRKKGEIMRALKGVLHKLCFFDAHDGVC